MQTLHIRTGAWLLVVASLILLFTACSTLNAGVDPVPPAAVFQPGTTVWNYQGASNIFTAAWSPNGRYVAIGEADGTVQVRDAVKGTVTLSLEGHTGAVWAIAWSPDGKRLATAGSDSTAQVWDTASGILLFTYRGHDGTISSLSWSPDSKRLASASFDHTVQVWDALTAKHAFTYLGHTSYVLAVA